MSESDEALVLKSRKLDRGAFEELVRRTARLVFSRILLAVGDPHQADDLTQETFMTAWQSIEQVRDASRFRPWLLSIARSTTLDALRTDGRQKRTAPGGAVSLESLDMTTDPNPDPAEHAQLDEQRKRVLAVLRELPEEYRQPLMLRYLAGADYATISQQLGLSNGSLRGLLSRGMEKLRERLGPDYIAEEKT